MAAKVKIYRGIPGSGKSWLADEDDRAVAGTWDICQVFSADNFFQDDKGKYVFDARRLGEAHAWCFRKYLEELALCQGEGDSHLLIVDNTNIHAWEIAPYVQAANAYGYESEVVTVWCDPVEAWKRETHGVGMRTIYRMYQDLLDERLPPFWKHTIIYPEQE